MDDPVLGLLLSPTKRTLDPRLCCVGGCQRDRHLSHSSPCCSCRQVACNRPSQSWPIPVVGRVLYPLVVRASTRQFHTPQLSRRDPASSIRLSVARSSRRACC